MTLKAVLFDFDDTLVETSGSREERARRAHQRLTDAGHQVGWSAFWRSVNEFQSDGYRRGVSPVMRDLGLEGTPLARECIDLWFFKGCEELIWLSPGCVEVLHELRQRFMLGIITNGVEDAQKHKFAHTGLEEFFDVFLPSGEVGIHKPDPRIFHIALERLGMLAHEAVFVGDNLDLDIGGSQRVGMSGIWDNPRRRPNDFYDIVPDATIRHLSELPTVIERLG
jgi:putative hydrolase of the HAD superfamily